MVLSFTEEQKKEIEARGITVIEFKRQIRNMGKIIDDAWKIFKEWADKITNAMNVFFEKLLEIANDVELIFEQIREACHYSTSRKYRIVKIYSKCTGTDIRFNWRMAFKIRRWLARSCC